MNYATVILEKEEKVATITLNRPRKLNAINDQMMDDVVAALAETAADQEIFAVILKGAGSSFCVGQDLSGVGTERVMPPDPRLRTYMTEVYRLGNERKLWLQRIFGSVKPVICQVHGYCLGLGCDLALAADTTIAAEDAVFGEPSIKMGLATANPLWMWRVGIRKTKELLFTGRYIDSKEAERIGLIDTVVPRDKLEEEVSIAAERVTIRGGIGGRDHEMAHRWVSTFDMAGLEAAWKSATTLHNLSSLQRYGFTPPAFSFYEVKDKKGLKGAIAERDAPYEKFFPMPRPKQG